MRPGIRRGSVEQATPRGTSAGRIAAIGCGVLLALVALAALVLFWAIFKLPPLLALAPVALVVVFALFLRQSARS